MLVEVAHQLLVQLVPSHQCLESPTRLSVRLVLLVTTVVFLVLLVLQDPVLLDSTAQKEVTACLNFFVHLVFTALKVVQVQWNVHLEHIPTLLGQLYVTCVKRVTSVFL